MSLRVLTLNCWGLKFVSKHRELRLRAIGDTLAKMAAQAHAEGAPYAFIGLQEIWVHSDFAYVRDRLREGGHLKWSKFFFTGALGAGLAIFSAFPIAGTRTNPYALNGSPLAVAAGDFYVAKAAGSILVKHPDLDIDMEVFVTHFHAQGGDDGPESQRAHRLVHAWELAVLVRESAERGRYVIALGDFNSLPTSLCMSILKEHAHLCDAWDATAPIPSAADPESASDASGSPTPASRFISAPDKQFTPEVALHTHGVTADSPLNTWSAGKPLSPIARRQHGKRLDYVLFRAPVHSASELASTEAKVMFADKLPEGMSFSDHFGVEATLVLRERGDGAPAGVRGETLEVAIDALKQYKVIAERTAMKQLTGMATAVAALLFLLAIPLWVPEVDRRPAVTRGVGFAVVFATGLVTWYGTTMFYAGFIYGNWESRGLRRVLAEMELVQERLAEGISD